MKTHRKEATELSRIFLQPILANRLLMTVKYSELENLSLCFEEIFQEEKLVGYFDKGDSVDGSVHKTWEFTCCSEYCLFL